MTKQTITLWLPAYWTQAIVYGYDLPPGDAEIFAEWEIWADEHLMLGKYVEASPHAEVRSEHDAGPKVGKCICRRYTFEVEPVLDALPEWDDEMDPPAPRSWWALAIISAVVLAMVVGLAMVRDPACTGDVQPARCAD